MMLEEDSEQNRMQDALQLFASITKMSAFARTTFILFLNKIDLFTKKIEVSKKPLEKLFPDYTGGPSAKAGAAYPQTMFLPPAARLPGFPLDLCPCCSAL